MKLPEIIVKFIKQTRLINKGDLVLLAISGGVDSVALLDSCCQVRHQLGIRFHVVHVDHCTRLSSKRDARLVAELANKYNLPLTHHVRLVKGISSLSEQAAREWRINVICKTARVVKAKAIFTAHHADDLAETVLMRIIRGAGLAGLRAVLPVSQWDDIVVLRPLLSVTRQQIVAYNHQHHLKWVNDETNDKDIFLRNKLRLNLLPLLAREYNPSIVEGLAGLANQANCDYDYIQRQANVVFKKIAQVTPNIVRLNVLKLVSLHVSLRRQIYRECLEVLCDDLTEFTSGHIFAIDGLLNDSAKVRIVLPRRLTVTKDDVYLIVKKS